jgi:hypothetical protein
VDHADGYLAGDPQGDRHAEMRDAVVVVHRAVDGIDDPLAVAVRITTHAFLPIERVAGAGTE